MEEYSQLVIQTTNWETECKDNLSNKLFQTLKVTKQAQDKSYQNYLMDFDKRTQYEQEMEEVKDNSRELVELTRD